VILKARPGAAPSELQIMARSPAPPPPRPANLSRDQMLSAIPKLKRRIQDVQEFDPGTVKSREDPRLDALSARLDAALVSIFPPETLEHRRYHYNATTIDTAGYNLNGTPMHEVHRGLVLGKDTVLHTLAEIIALFEEELGEAGGSAGDRAIKAYDGLDLHPEIARAASELYRNGHYANAIEDAVKALNNLVRLRSGSDKDGTTLMEQVFSPKNPILKFNALADESDVNEQKGFMMMFSGAVSGLRNPRAHKIIQDDPESALEFIAFVSLLAKLVDKTTK